MRVSEHFSLNKNQAALGFVDVDISTDIPVFIDPAALRLVESEWGLHCVRLVDNYFGTLLSAVKRNDESVGLGLLRELREPNETHLGFSAGQSRGRALGPRSAQKLWDALKRSRAAQTGLIEDLEDTILLVEGISVDIVSDITTNVIRSQLIAYTQEVCREYSIPMEAEVDSGPLWNSTENHWTQSYVSLPAPSNRKLVLVPKIIVRRTMSYSIGEYYHDFILEYQRDREIQSLGSLVSDRGSRRVTNKELREKYGAGKPTVIKETQLEPTLIERYKRHKNENPQMPMDHYEISEATDAPEPDWDLMLNRVLAVEPGRSGAAEYHAAVRDLLDALFYPELNFGQSEQVIHAGRKRIDITYVNLGRDEFFGWLRDSYQAPYVHVECKNYRSDPANPELDQLSGRFSPTRGEFGILVCRTIDDMPKMIARCQDTAKDRRGYIVPLQDNDLFHLVSQEKSRTSPRLPSLHERFREITH